MKMLPQESRVKVLFVCFRGFFFCSSHAHPIPYSRGWVPCSSSFLPKDVIRYFLSHVKGHGLEISTGMTWQDLTMHFFLHQTRLQTPDTRCNIHCMFEGFFGKAVLVVVSELVLLHVLFLLFSTVLRWVLILFGHWRPYKKRENRVSE